MQRTPPQRSTTQQPTTQQPTTQTRLTRTPTAQVILLSCITLAFIGLSSGCSDDADKGPDLIGAQSDAWEVEIQRTEDGVPHIKAETLSSAMFGVGYAFASDHACTLLEMIHRVRGDSAKHFGPGADNINIDQDFAMRHLGVYAQAQDELGEQSSRVMAALDGYSAGFNYRLTSDPDTIPSLCRGESWVREITPTELLAYYRFLALTGSSRQLLSYIGNAAPPAPRGAMGAFDSTPRGHISDLSTPPLSSNGYALGSELTGGAGMVLANPHFPWQGELRLWEMHIEVPGLLNVYGSTLLGVPAVLIGFNEHIAWTHTFSLAPRFTLYMLRLDPEDPTRYRYGDDILDMTSADYSVEVLHEDGTLETVERTLYSSHYGPILNIDPLGWSKSQALTFRDANAGNDRIIEQFLSMNLATDLDSFSDAHLTTIRGIPWVHTMAASRDGEVYYADAGAMPYVSDERFAAWRARVDGGDPMSSLIYNLAGQMLLDGSDPEDEWTIDEDAVEPGIVPHHLAPTMRRRDYVMNSNDSARVPHHTQHLNDVPRIYNTDPIPLGMRGRNSLSLLSNPPTEDGLIDAASLRRLAFEHPGFAGELWRGEIVEQCRQFPSVMIDEGEVDLQEACDVLEAWDGTYQPESRGAVLFREVIHTRWINAELYESGRLGTTPFDQDDPLNTPAGLATGTADDPSPGLRALAAAQAKMRDNGLELDVELGDVQFVVRRGEAEPMGGALNFEGGVHSMWLGREAVSKIDEEPTIPGPYPLTYGSSFMMVVTWEDGIPAGHSILGYGQSGDPESPRFDSQLSRMREGDWREIRFTAEQISSDPSLDSLELNIER